MDVLYKNATCSSQELSVVLPTQFTYIMNIIVTNNYESAFTITQLVLCTTLLFFQAKWFNPRNEKVTQLGLFIITYTKILLYTYSIMAYYFDKLLDKTRLYQNPRIIYYLLNQSQIIFEALILYVALQKYEDQLLFRPFEIKGLQIFNIIIMICLLIYNLIAAVLFNYCKGIINGLLSCLVIQCIFVIVIAIPAFILYYQDKKKLIGKNSQLLLVKISIILISIGSIVRLIYESFRIATNGDLFEIKISESYPQEDQNIILVEDGKFNIKFEDTITWFLLLHIIGPYYFSCYILQVTLFQDLFLCICLREAIHQLYVYFDPNDHLDQSQQSRKVSKEMLQSFFQLIFKILSPFLTYLTLEYISINTRNGRQTIKFTYLAVFQKLKQTTSSKFSLISVHSSPYLYSMNQSDLQYLKQNQIDFSNRPRKKITYSRINGIQVFKFSSQCLINSCFINPIVMRHMNVVYN
ncbi:hypothetical protein pb186bvf_011846 [Paramecium bursaria]